MVASALVPACQEESCVDERLHKTTGCSRLLSPRHEQHGGATAQVSAHNQEHAESAVWSPPSFYLIGMSQDGLNPLKLTKHPLRQISHHAGIVSEPSRVKADPLKRTCLTMISIRMHRNASQVQGIQMVSTLVWCAQTKSWYKKHRAWTQTVIISCPGVLASHTSEVLIYPSLQQYTNNKHKNLWHSNNKQ